jgi:maltodextrin utilization protein YvdJ
MMYSGTRSCLGKKKRLFCKVAGQRYYSQYQPNQFMLLAFKDLILVSLRMVDGYTVRLVWQTKIRSRMRKRASVII